MITLNAEKFIEILNQKGYDYRQEGETIIIESSGINNSEGSFLITNVIDRMDFDLVVRNNGWASMDSLLNVTGNLTFENNGWVDINNVKKVSGKLILRNKGRVYLNRITELSENIVFENSDLINLPSVERVKNNSTVTFKNLGEVNLDNIIETPNGFIFRNYGDVFFRALKPEDIVRSNAIFENEGWIICNVKISDLEHPGFSGYRLLKEAIKKLQESNKS